MKICTGCNIEKELNEFYKHKTGKYGVVSKCKACKKEYGKEWREANADYGKEWHKANAEKIKEWYKANSDKKKEYNKDYKKYNADRIKEKRESNKQDVVYRFEFNQMVYVGSTNSFRKRVTKHISDCFNPSRPQYNFPLYKFIRQHFTKADKEAIRACFSIIREVEPHEDLKAVEQAYIDSIPYENRLNVINAIR